MNYGFHIEMVNGGYIVTYAEPSSYAGLASASGLSKQTKYVFSSKDELLKFLREKL